MSGPRVMLHWRQPPADIVAAHSVANGPKRHFAAAQQSFALGGKADIRWQKEQYNFYEYTPQSVFRPIRRLRIEHALIAEFERHRAGFAERHRAIKTRAAAGVAGAGDLLDLDPDRVLVAVDAHLDDALGVAGGLALLPQRAPRAAEIPGLPRCDGLRQRLGIHVRDHQHIA